MTRMLWIHRYDSQFINPIGGCIYLWFILHLWDEVYFMFPLVISLVKLEPQSQFVGNRSVPRNICLLWNPSRRFTWWAHIAFFCLVSKFLLPGGRGEEKKRREGEGGDAGRSPSLCFVAKGRWKAFLLWLSHFRHRHINYFQCFF